MQQPLSTGHGAPLQNSSTAPERHQQVPNKAALAPTAGQYDFTYFQNNYQPPVHNIIRPSLCPTSLGTPQGSGQMYTALPLGPNLITARPQLDPTFVSTPPQGGYVPSGGHYPGQVSYNVPSQSTTQGIPPHSYPGFPYHPTMPVFNTHYNAPLISQTVHPATSQPLVGVLTSHVKPLPEGVQRPTQASFQSYPVGNTAASWHPLPGASITASTGPITKPTAAASSSNSQTSAGPPLSMPHNINQSYLPDRAKVITFPVVGAPLARRPPPLADPPVSASASPAPASEAQEGMHYGYVANNQVNSAPSPLSSTSDDEDDDDEAGVDSSSSSSSSTNTSLPNNYDALEGGSCQDSISSTTAAPALSDPRSLKSTKPFGYAYPTLQPAYQNVASPLQSVGQPTGPGYSPGPQQFPQPFSSVNQLSPTMEGLSLRNNRKAEALRQVSLLQERNILPPVPILSPQSNLSPELKKLNCSPDLFRCTLMNIPQTQALLNKAKLPLGLLIHPFRDLTHLPVITSSTIVRCRTCRTYINPFVTFLDQRRWKCNLCYRVNDDFRTVKILEGFMPKRSNAHQKVPEEFMYNPLTRSYGEPQKRPEVQTATVEFIASSDYMLRPPQPAVYLFVFDVSHNAVESGYLDICCQSLLENFDKLPGDSRTRIGFITFDSTVHFFNLQEGVSQPQMLIVSDIEDIFIPTPDSLMVNLHESKELIKDLLKVLPTMFTNTRETHSALGPALQAAFKLMCATGGRISVFQTQLPSVGVGHLLSREDPNQRSTIKGVQHLAPATDFYKKFALDCSGQQVAVDLFLLSGQYTDMASLACMSKYSAGSVFYYPSFHHIHNPAQVEKFQKDLKRYLIRKIGFEAVMRIRCTKGLSIHTFHGNFFVRSTDLLSLANINPDSGFTVQMSIEENLVDTSIVCFQAALLYTSSKGERRIRVHTLCLPVVKSVADVYAGADVQAITCLLATMAVDRSVSSSISDARDALVNAVVDSLSAYRSTVSNLQQSVLVAPNSLRLFALYILALLKQQAFRTGTSTRLDERVFAMCEMKTQPLVHLMLTIHPNLYRIDNLPDEGSITVGDKIIPQPPILQLSAEKLSKEGAFLMDCGSAIYLWVGKNCSSNFISEVLGFPNYASIPQNMTQLPELNTILSQRTSNFVSWLRDSRPFLSILYIVKDDSPMKANFYQKLVEDRSESALSYYEFLLHIQQQISK
ncbi:protein transport protein Sec24B-like isoform X2 [Scyliorhinus canicula]|uniref:protein transport protein Sec24B-like isoform X2 n=1 Tax=Scyliorhinus canicula TaxID=7830 RepID=UPI0018F45F1A|nr:protein transport protein Sec24B-like isoform X2 [Scyliorhinus canicula]